MSSIDVLPCEIFMQIFRHLNIFDKKNLRLTCKCLYSVCNDLLFGNFVLKNYDLNFHSVVQLIAQSGFKHLNLKFVKTEFYSEPAMNAFWDKCGFKVKCLRLNECSMSEDDLREIITKCENIEHLSLVKCDVPFEVHWTLDALVADALRIESLTSLKIKYCKWITNDAFNKFCALYPNIRNMKLEPYSSSFTYDCIINKIRESAKIFECLDLNWGNGFKDNELVCIASVPNLRLKKLCINDHDKITCAGFKMFFLKQSCLEYLDVSESFDFTPEYLQQLLKHCSHLHTLKMRCSIEYFYEMLKLVSTSHLKALEIHPRNEFDASRIILPVTQLANYHLNYLNIIYFRLSEEGYLWIIRVFRRLQCITEDTLGFWFVVTKEVLRAMTCYQTNLKKLKVDNTSSTYDVPKQYVFQSLSYFKGLQYLELHFCGTIDFKCLVLPQLKHLKMFNTDDEAQTFREYDLDMVLLCHHNHSIEYFSLSGFNFYCNLVDSIIMNLPKLRELKLLFCVQYHPEIDLHHSQIANHHVLRNVTIEYEVTVSSRRVSFYRYTCTYNIFTKKWEQKTAVRKLW